MTKKAKKKSLKTGYRAPDEPRCTTVSVGYSASCGSKRPTTTDIDADNEETDLPLRLSKAERRHLERQKKQKQVEDYNQENRSRVVYPIDLWFLIGRFVRPELVKSFSLICVDAYKVTCTRKFWLELYRRYVVDHKSLPSHLQPNAVNTNVGLKVRVVRSLFHAHRPFHSKTLQHVPLTDSPTVITRDLMVESHWWKRLVSAKGHIYVWRLHFKLVDVDKSRNYSTNKNSKLTSCRNEHDLIHFNPEQKYSMLQVTATSFVNVPTNIFGMCLTDISIGTSRNLKTHKVKLFFHEYRTHGKYNQSQASVLTIDPVFDVQLLNWWDPEYPHPFDR